MDLRVLVLEDDSIIGLYLTKILSDAGYEVIGVAATAREGIERAKKQRPDLIIADIRLKGNEDGMEALAKIQRQRKQPINVIVMTGFQHRYKDPLLPPNAYILRKPFLPEEVLDAIAKIKTPNQESISTKAAS